MPVIVKLTPNVADVTAVGRAAVQAGADALALINTINSIVGVDLDTFAPRPSVRGEGSHGGYCGPAVKPIALNMVAALAGDPAVTVPIGGIGGSQRWQDVAEFFLLGASSVQVGTAVMHHGFRIVDHLVDGLDDWLRSKGIARMGDIIGRSVPRIRKWGDLDLSSKVVAQIDQDRCIQCGLCYVACEAGCHQSIRWDSVPTADYLAAHGNGAPLRRSGGIATLPGPGVCLVNLFAIKTDSCVGCNMCSLVCPVENCITKTEVDSGRPPMAWEQYQGKLPRGEVEPIGPPAHV